VLFSINEHVQPLKSFIDYVVLKEKCEVTESEMIQVTVLCFLCDCKSLGIDL